MLRATRGAAEIGVGRRVEGLRVDDTRITEDEPNLIEDPKTLAVFLAKVREEEPQHLAFIGTLVTTGLRMSTALALRREDFEPEWGVIVARRRISANEIVEGVKRSRTARDVVPLVEWVWEAVRAEWAGPNEKQRGSGLAFPSATGGFRARSHLDKPIDRIAAELKIPRLTPHGLRRPAALLDRRELGSAVSMAIARHLTEEMHRHHAPVGAAERSAAGQTAFGALGSPTGPSGRSRARPKPGEANIPPTKPTSEASRNPATAEDGQNTRLDLSSPIPKGNRGRQTEARVTPTSEARRAGHETRTRDFNLGKVALYQLS
jgi:hypothetical protein